MPRTNIRAFAPDATQADDRTIERTNDPIGDFDSSKQREFYGCDATASPSAAWKRTIQEGAAPRLQAQQRLTSWPPLPPRGDWVRSLPMRTCRRRAVGHRRSSKHDTGVRVHASHCHRDHDCVRSQRHLRRRRAGSTGHFQRERRPDRKHVRLRPPRRLRQGDRQGSHQRQVPRQRHIRRRTCGTGDHQMVQWHRVAQDGAGAQRDRTF